MCGVLVLILLERIARMVLLVFAKGNAAPRASAKMVIFTIGIKIDAPSFRTNFLMQLAALLLMSLQAREHPLVVESLEFVVVQ